MLTRLNVTSIYVLDKDEALDFYVNKLGLEKGSDFKQGDYRWLTVRVPGQPDVEISLEQPGPPLHDEATAEQIRELISKGAMSGLVFHTDDARALYETLQERGVSDFTQEPIDHFYGTDMGLRDPFGNAIRILERKTRRDGDGLSPTEANRRTTWPAQQAGNRDGQGLHRGRAAAVQATRPRAQGGYGAARRGARGRPKDLQAKHRQDAADDRRWASGSTRSSGRRARPRPEDVLRHAGVRRRTARRSASSSPSRSSRFATRRSASSPTRSSTTGRCGRPSSRSSS
jgi:catechol 2,3-dioxygenase-like lactoylglutathione lyase family enzyme